MPKPRIPQPEDLVATNPKVDEKVLGEIITMVARLRQSGVAKRQFGLVGPYEHIPRADPAANLTPARRK